MTKIMYLMHNRTGASKYQLFILFLRRFRLILSSTFVLVKDLLHLGILFYIIISPIEKVLLLDLYYVQSILRNSHFTSRSPTV